MTRLLTIIALILLAATVPQAEPVQARPQAEPVEARRLSNVEAQAPTYIVTRGDTWTAVSTRYGLPICALASANGHRRCSSIYRASSALMVGQTLEVPYAH